MIRKISLAVLFLTASTIIFGCDFGPPAPPTIPLTQSQVSAVMTCQHTIKQWGKNFMDVKLTNLEACLDEVLYVQILFENGLTTPETYQNGLAEARRDCLTKFRHIGRFSTTMINKIVSACAPVESIILPSSGYDPLEFGALSGFTSSITNVTQLAGEICVAKELAVDLAVFFEVPRMANLLDILDDDTTGTLSGTFSTEGPDGTELPNIPLDPRCNFSFSTPTPTPTSTPTPTETPTPTATATPDGG